MKTRSQPEQDSIVISVVGGMIMDMIFETERIPDSDESLDASSLAYKPGGKGSNTSIAIYRGRRKKPADDLTSKANDQPPEAPMEPHLKENGACQETEDKYKAMVYLNTAVGSDEFGKTLRKNMQRNGIDISGVKTIAGQQSGTCAVFVDTLTRGSRDIGYPGANTLWTPKQSNSVLCLAAGFEPDLVVCHLETKRETVEQVLRTAREQGVETLLNPSPVYYLPSDVYPNVTHLVVNEIEAAELSGRTTDDMKTPEQWKDAANVFLNLGVKNVVITLGEAGAYYATEDTDGIVPAAKNVKIVDATGAGDTFVGNYALEYVRQMRSGVWDIKKAVERGCKASARTLEQLGAQESIPWADEIDSVGL